MRRLLKKLLIIVIVAELSKFERFAKIFEYDEKLLPRLRNFPHQNISMHLNIFNLTLFRHLNYKTDHHSFFYLHVKIAPFNSCQIGKYSRQKTFISNNQK